ncbi:MAG TPA: hypothetical protein VLR90_11920 [Blastocatellia bacterium]|nr:hypothetical protein [Blastocatellia bacterium]
MNLPITIQDIDDATAKWLSEEAKRRGVNVESLIVELIHKGIGVEREGMPLKSYHDLDSLAGTWNEEQEAEFLNAVSDFEQLDEKLW